LILSKKSSTKNLCLFAYASEIEPMKIYSGRKLTFPPFFRSSLLLILVFFGTGCGAITENYPDYCTYGPELFWIDTLAAWLNVAIQSGVIGFVIMVVISIILYVPQLFLVKKWAITESPKAPPSYSSWVIPVALTIIVFAHLVFFLGLLGCGMIWVHMLSILLGSLLGWFLIFNIYLIFLRKLTYII